MGKSYLPRSDGDLRGWACNLVQRLGADPARLGVDQQLFDAFEAAATQYAEAFAAASNLNTRSVALVRRKNDAREALKIVARRVALTLYGQREISGEQLLQLGLTVRKTRSAQPAPGHKPMMSIVSVNGREVTVLLKDAQAPSRRGRPQFVSGALVYSHAGDQLPADIDGWRYELITGKTRVRILFPPTVPPGTKVWFTARWFNGRKQMGELAEPVCVHIAGSHVQPSGQAA